MPSKTRIAAASVAVVVALSALVALSGCCAPGADVVARVNDESIKRTEVEAQLAQMKKSSPQTFAGDAGQKREQEYRGKILESLIQLALVRQGAESLGVEVSDKDIAAYTARTEKQYGGATQFDEALKQAGTSREQFEQLAMNRLLIEAVTAKLAKQKTFTDAQVAEYYKTNKSLFAQRPQVLVRQIVVAGDKKDLASQVLAKAKSGGDFAALAKQYSIESASKNKGGSVGWAEASRFETAMAEQLAKMKPGAYAMVKTRIGWHVFQLQERKSAAERPLSEVADQIKSILAQQNDAQAFTAFVAELRRKATIEITDEELRKTVEGAASTQQQTP